MVSGGKSVGMERSGRLLTSRCHKAAEVTLCRSNGVVLGSGNFGWEVCSLAGFFGGELQHKAARGVGSPDPRLGRGLGLPSFLPLGHRAEGSLREFCVFGSGTLLRCNSALRPKLPAFSASPSCYLVREFRGNHSPSSLLSEAAVALKRFHAGPGAPRAGHE